MTALYILAELDLEVQFEPEESFWMDYIGDVEDPKEWQRKFENGEAEVLYAYVKGDDEILASLGGIVVTCDEDGRKYLKEIEKELLDEALEYLMRGAK